MPNLFDYLDWRSDLSFQNDKINEIDFLILSRLSYLPFDDCVKNGFSEKIILKDALTQMLENNKTDPLKYRFIMKDDKKLAEFLIKSSRFSDLNVTNFKNKIDADIEKQFSAISIFLNKKDLLVSYRGTDDLLVSWKEDFNMSFSTNIPSWVDSVNYLNDASAHAKTINVVGHSKGGNLAVYAAAFCNSQTKKKLIKVISHDGPGFFDEITNTNEYKNIENKIQRIIPKSSVVGLLMSTGEHKVVESTQNGIMQHDLFSWQVLGNKFLYAEGLDAYAKITDRSMHKFLEEMAPEKRKQFVDATFEIFKPYADMSFKELLTAKNLAKIAMSIKDLDDEKKHLIQEGFNILKNTTSESVKDYYQIKMPTFKMSEIFKKENK